MKIYQQKNCLKIALYCSWALSTAKQQDRRQTLFAVSMSKENKTEMGCGLNCNDGDISSTRLYSIHVSLQSFSLTHSSLQMYQETAMSGGT